MKRLWLGIFLLVFLLAAGLTAADRMEKIHTGLSRQLNIAAEAAVRDDWDTAASHFRQAQAIRIQHQKLAAALTDHDPMDDINGLFAALEIYLRQQSPDFPAICGQVARLAQSLALAQKLSWWNFL